jgi:cyclic-di-GMP phosphodiesterase TipF (flagellum assembly factor)
LSSATLGNEREANRVLSLLDANRAICQYVQFLIIENQWADFKMKERDIIGKIAKMGAGFSLSDVRSLRLDYAELAESGVGSVRADVERFIEQPASYTDYHTADIAAYVNRFEVDLIMTNVRTEQHILTLLDDGIGLAQGPHLALPGPIRTDFMARSSGAHKLKLARS